MRQFSRVVARNSAFGMAAQMAIKLLSFGFSVLVVRNLGAEAFGQYSAVLAFGAMFVFLADLGLSPYAVREVARMRDAEDGAQRVNTLYSNVLALRLILSSIAAALLIGTAWLTDRPLIMVGAITLNAFGLIIYAVQGTNDAVLAGFERLDRSSIAKVIYQIVFVVGGAIALALGAGYYGLIGATLLAVVLLTYTCWNAARGLGVRFVGINAQLWPKLLRASLPFGVIGFTLGLAYKFDSVLLNIFRGDAETGYYNAAYNLVFSAAMISNVLNTALYPSLTRQAGNAPQSLPTIYDRTLRYLLLLGLPIAIGGWALADQIIPYLFKAAYLPAVPALQIVIWVVPLMFTSEFLGYVVLIAGQERWVARSVIISTSVNVVANLLLVPMFGLLGAAVMTVITEAVLVGQYLWVLRATVRQFSWGATLLRPLLAALLMGAQALALRALPLLANIVLAVLSYTILLLLLGVLGRDELRFVRGLRRPSEAVS